MNGGYLGVAVDEFGNFSNGTEGRSGGIGFTPDAFAWVLYGRKGGRFFGLGSGLDPATGNPILNAPQLQRLGKLIVGRI